MMKNRQRIRKTLLLISFLLFPVTLFFFSPVLPIEGAVQGIIVGSIIIFFALFVISLFLGRVFCGWTCAAGALQEYCSSINGKKLSPGKKIYWKYIVWALWIGGIALGLISYGRFPSTNILFSTYYGISVHQPLIYVIYYAVLALVVIPSIIIGERAFCRYMCWIEPFMTIGNKVRGFLHWPALHLDSNKDKCNNCKLCNKNCPMSLDVNGMVQAGSMINNQCVLCGSCVDICPNCVLRYCFKG